MYKPSLSTITKIVIPLFEYLDMGNFLALKAFLQTILSFSIQNLFTQQSHWTIIKSQKIADKCYVHRSYVSQIKLGHIDLHLTLSGTLYPVWDT